MIIYSCQYHPDVNTDSQASEVFKSVHLAYEDSFWNLITADLTVNINEVDLYVVCIDPFVINARVNYTDSPCGLRKIWIWSLVFLKYMDGHSGLHFVMHLVPTFAKSHMDGPCGLRFVTPLVPNVDLLKPLDLLVGD
ncbi:hypothetical protein Hanom_Chr02g00166781 [Helianthus anomalus]